MKVTRGSGLAAAAFGLAVCGPGCGGSADDQTTPDVARAAKIVTVGGPRTGVRTFSGRVQAAHRVKAKEKLYGLRLDRPNAEELISQRILSALDDAAASWPAISLRRHSADAAAKTLELVQDAYGRGAASILDLLDVQNAALSAEIAAETAVYSFLDDWAEVQRAVADLGRRNL